MKLVLFRHATRSPYEVGDASLNTTGLAQANRLPRMLAPQGPLPVPTHLFSSPKKRAKQTLHVISETLGLPIIIDANLDERKNTEAVSEFDDRVRQVFERVSKIPNNDSVVYICSHLDWLESALGLWPIDAELDAHSWAAGQFHIFKLQDGLCVSQGGGVVGASND